MTKNCGNCWMGEGSICCNPDSGAFNGEITGTYTCVHWVDRAEAEKKKAEDKEVTKLVIRGKEQCYQLH